MRTLLESLRVCHVSRDAHADCSAAGWQQLQVFRCTCSEVDCGAARPHAHSVVVGHFCRGCTTVLSLLQQQEAKLRVCLHVCLAGLCLPCHSMPHRVLRKHLIMAFLHLQQQGVCSVIALKALCTVGFGLQGSSLCTFSGLRCVQDCFQLGDRGGTGDWGHDSMHAPLCRHHGACMMRVGAACDTHAYVHGAW